MATEKKPNIKSPSPSPHVSLLAQKYTTEALRVIRSIMRDTKVDPTPRLRAAETLLKIGWGRPPEYHHVHLQNEVGDQLLLFDLSDEELAVIAAKGR